MTNDQFNEMILNNSVLLVDVNHGPVTMMRDRDNPTALHHLDWMLSAAKDFHSEGLHDKAHRWVGYVQGVLAGKYNVPLSDLMMANSV